MQQLDEANYLLFAIALRLVGSLENIRNPKSRPDIPSFAFKSPNGEYAYIHLESFVSKLFEKTNGPEPTVPFRVYSDYREFHADAPYDFVSLALSPRYAPKEADGLAAVIERYFCLI